MEHVVDNSTAYGLREAGSHPEDHPPRAPELGEGVGDGVNMTIRDPERSKGRDLYTLRGQYVENVWR